MKIKEEKETKTFKQFVDDLLCKHDSIYERLKDPRPYHEYQNLRALVGNEMYDEMKMNSWYMENRKEADGIIAETIVMTLYVQSLNKKESV